MGEVLVGIQPQELNFIFELKKQSSCSIHLTNKSDDYVAFKVKTTSPKRYCVRPNTGVILPRSTCDFTVTMQAQKETPPDMQLKDKFLIQSTVVPIGTTDEDIVSSTFSKENNRYIQENKLRVVLVSPSHLPARELLKGAEKFEPDFTVPVSVDISKTSDDNFKEEVVNHVVATEPNYNFAKLEITRDAMLSKPRTDALKLEPTKEVVELENIHINDGDSKDDSNHELPLSKESEPSTVEALNRLDDFASSHAAEDVNVLISRINDLEMKLEKAHNIIGRLTEDSRVADKQRDKLLQDIALLRRKPIAKAQVGFPFLFVVFVAFIGMIGGHLLH